MKPHISTGAIRLMALFPVLRITLAIFDAYGTLYLGQQLMPAQERIYTSSPIIVPGLSFADLPFWTQVVLIGIGVHVMVFSLCVLALWLQWPWGPSLFLGMSVVTFVWQIVRLLFFHGSLILPFLSFAALLIAWWFLRQPSVQKWYRINQPIGKGSMISIGGIPLELVVAGIIIAGVIAWQAIGFVNAMVLIDSLY